MKFTFLQVKEVMMKDRIKLIGQKTMVSMIFEDFSLVNCLSHRMNKKQ